MEWMQKVLKKNVLQGARVFSNISKKKGILFCFACVFEDKNKHKKFMSMKRSRGDHVLVGTPLGRVPNLFIAEVSCWCIVCVGTPSRTMRPRGAKVAVVGTRRRKNIRG